MCRDKNHQHTNNLIYHSYPHDEHLEENSAREPTKTPKKKANYPIKYKGEH